MNNELTPPKTRSIHQSLGYWTSLFARTMEAEFNQRLAQFEVTRIAGAVLGAIHIDGKSTPSEVAEFLSVDRASITRLLDRLEKQNLLTRHRTGEDRRSVTLLLTPEGKALNLELAQESRAVNELFTSGLTQEEIDQYISTVKKMLANGKNSVASL